MTRRITFAAALAALVLAACDHGKDAAGGAVEARSAAPLATMGAPATSTHASSTAPPTSAAPSTSASEAATDAPPGKTWDCGAKGQKPCPMQGWMKTTLGPAAGNDDAAKLASGLTFLATHAPPGYPAWVSMSQAGAAKAKAGDLEGAKESCKQCHDAYKEKYKETMRDRPFG